MLKRTSKKSNHQTRYRGKCVAEGPGEDKEARDQRGAGERGHKVGKETTRIVVSRA